MEDNYCCPYLNIVECTDTDEHNHLACAAALMMVIDTIIDNEWIMEYCLNNFDDCQYRELLK